MTLSNLNLERTKVTDLAPLRGLPIDYLMLDQTPVSDLSPLKGKLFSRLSLYKCENIKDLSPLANEALQWENQQPAADFWKEWDAKKRHEDGG